MKMTLSILWTKSCVKALKIRLRIQWWSCRFFKKGMISFGGRTCARADEACIYGAWLVHRSGTEYHVVHGFGIKNLVRITVSFLSLWTVRFHVQSLKN